jgi:hypothetical protein
MFLVGSLPLLHLEVQTVEEELDGWRNQQLCRNLDHHTIDGRIGLVRRFIAHTNEYPWSWTLTDVAARRQIRATQLRRLPRFRGGGAVHTRHMVWCRSMG